MGAVQGNLRRPVAEIGPLLKVIVEGLQNIAETGRWQIRHLGDLDLLPEDLCAEIRAIQCSTSGTGPGILNIALAYSGRTDIVTAVRRLLIDQPAILDDEAYDADAIADLLGRKLSTDGQPDPDLVIRTSGVQRLSGFMPWQTAYSELYFTSVDWPDFTEAEFDTALATFLTRERRFGV